VRRTEPQRHDVRRRRALALVALVLAFAGLGAAVWWAVPHVREEAAPPPPPPPPPPPKPFRIVFPEGFTRAQMVDRVGAVKKIAERKRKRKVVLNPVGYRVATRRAPIPCFAPRVRTNLEGFLFPATYDFLRGTTSRQLAVDQIEAFCRNWQRLDLRYARSKNLTPYDVLIIASMVERETQAPSERPLVAAVIYNRLARGIPLGIDATLRYGLGIPPTESIHESQLASDSKYNTRKFAGLPPTPIGNPGRASMQAAARPAKVPYLYFVRKPDKVHHFFTASAAEFNRYACAHGYGC
jgi:cell division protein YceG involved in septum cleavage